MCWWGLCGSSTVWQRAKWWMRLDSSELNGSGGGNLAQYNLSVRTYAARAVLYFIEMRFNASLQCVMNRFERVASWAKRTMLGTCILYYCIFGTAQVPLVDSQFGSKSFHIQFVWMKLSFIIHSLISDLSRWPKRSTDNKTINRISTHLSNIRGSKSTIVSHSPNANSHAEMI